MTYLKALREDAPLLDAYLSYFEVTRTPFTIPGHKQRASKLDLGLGAVVDGDTPLYGGLDEIKLTNQILKSAEARTAHRSVLSALVLAGLEPIWLAPEIDLATGVPTGIPLSELERVIVQNPIALLLTEPGYLGTISQLPELISKAHEYKIPVIIDAAWGAHFGFQNDLPKHVLQLGADALITSTHKALPGYSASALLVARGEFLNLDRLEQSFETTHTTSPAGAPLASIDGCRALLQTRGEELLTELISNVTNFKADISQHFDRAIFLSPADFKTGRFDPVNIVLRANQLGTSGVTIENELLKANIRVEMADRDTVVFLATLADDAESFAQLKNVLLPILQNLVSAPRESATALSWSVVPQIGISMRDAYFADTEMLPAEKAQGRISADLIAPYPPGVAVVAPGEVLTEAILAGLAANKAAGVRIAYATDPTLLSYRVVKSS